MSPIRPPSGRTPLTTADAASAQWPARLLDQVADTLRTRGYVAALRQASAEWIRRSILFRQVRHPRELEAATSAAFLDHLAGLPDLPPAAEVEARAALTFLYEVRAGPAAGRTAHIGSDMAVSPVGPACRAGPRCVPGPARQTGPTTAASTAPGPTNRRHPVRSSSGAGAGEVSAVVRDPRCSQAACRVSRPLSWWGPPTWRQVFREHFTSAGPTAARKPGPNGRCLSCLSPGSG
jgi:hypothetical protein